MGTIKKISGMEMHRDYKAWILHLSQRSYVQKVIEFFGMYVAKSKNIHFNSYFKISFEMCL